MSATVGLAERGQRRPAPRARAATDTRGALDAPPWPPPARVRAPHAPRPPGRHVAALVAGALGVVDRGRRPPPAARARGVRVGRHRDARRGLCGQRLRPPPHRSPRPAPPRPAPPPAPRDPPPRPPP